VACPFFMPMTRMDQGPWSPAPRMPLGDPYRGACHVRPAEIFEPPEISQRDLCNCGYARGRCANFPDDSAADAVRFSITGDAGARVQLVYIIERNHAPAEFGSLAYAVDEARFVEAHPSELLSAQARAFVESYLMRRLVPLATSAP